MRFAIITVSDRSYQGVRPDFSGPALVEKVSNMGWNISHTSVVPDEMDIIYNKLVELIDIEGVDIILTTGGTGFSPRDITPEATRMAIERLTPGLDEAMRANSLLITKNAMLSRAISGIRKKSIIINLPGSPKAAIENFSVIAPVLEHGIKLLQNDPESELGHQQN